MNSQLGDETEVDKDEWKGHSGEDRGTQETGRLLISLRINCKGSFSYT